MSCGSCMKVLFYFFNGFLLLLGLASLGVGIWMAVNADSFLDATKLGEIDTISPGLVEVSGYVMIAAGAATVLFIIIGIVGAATENKCLLGLYIAVLVIALAVQVAAIVLGVVFRKDIEEKLDDRLTENINSKYHGPETANANRFTSAWNTLMKEFKCCGVRNASADFLETRRWDRMDNGTLLYVPSTCCRDGYPDCASINNSTNWYTEGCLTKITGLLFKYHAVVIGISAGIVGFQFFLVVLAAYLLAHRSPGYKMGKD